MKKYVLIILIFASLLGLYGHYFEAQQLTVNTVEIRNDTFSKVLKHKTILLISDLHFSDTKTKMLTAVLNQVKKIKPAMICLGGDYVEWFATEPAYRQAEYFLARLEAPLGVYAVMGDADYTLSRFSCLFCHKEGTAETPQKHSVQFLKNESVQIKSGDQILNIAGLNTEKDLAYNDQVIGRLTENDPTILLSHSSQIYNIIPQQKNVLVLSGDTHGGQVYLPIWMWKILKRKPDPAHMYGYFHQGQKNLYVSNGVGTTDLDLRIGIPPQITIIKFLPEKEGYTDES